MNRALAAVYAITIGSRRPGGNFTPDECDALIKTIPDLIEQVKRLDRLLADPFIHGYLQRFGEPGGADNG